VEWEGGMVGKELGRVKGRERGEKLEGEERREVCI
jgi:hypothetical protein